MTAVFLPARPENFCAVRHRCFRQYDGEYMFTPAREACVGISAAPDAWYSKNQGAIVLAKHHSNGKPLCARVSRIRNPYVLDADAIPH
jgi:hypothetical protein